jgi:hypothetical protein
VHKVPARLARVRTAVVTLRGRHVPALTRLVDCLRDDLACSRQHNRKSKAARTH